MCSNARSVALLSLHASREARHVDRVVKRREVDLDFAESGGDKTRAGAEPGFTAECTASTDEELGSLYVCVHARCKPTQDPSRTNRVCVPSTQQ